MMGKRIRDAQPDCRSFLPLQDSPPKLEHEQGKSREIGESVISHCRQVIIARESRR